jgi:hypothetical protein
MLQHRLQGIAGLWKDRPLGSKAEAEHGEGSVSVIASLYTVPCTAMGFMFTQ